MDVCLLIDLASFDMEIVLDRRLVTEHSKRLRFVERESDEPCEDEPGLKEFLRDSSLSGAAAENEIEFLKKLRFNGKHPTALYYYRELQNLRDPIHFRGPVRTATLGNSARHRTDVELFLTSPLKS